MEERETPAEAAHGQVRSGGTPEPAGDRPSEDRPSSDARHTARATVWAAVLTSVVAVVVAFGISDDASEEEPTPPQPSESASPQQGPAPTDGDQGRVADASPSAPAWTAVWENQGFRLPPPPSFGDETLIDFDAPDGPNVYVRDGDDVDEDTDPGDINYHNSVYAYLGLLPERQLGLAGKDVYGPEDCRRVASSLSFHVGDLGLSDDKRAASPVDVGSVLCMTTEQGNVVRIEVTALRDPQPGSFESTGGSYTLEGTATLWRRAS